MLLLKELIALGPNWISVWIQLESFLGAAGKVSLQSVHSMAKEKSRVSTKKGWHGGWDFIFFFLVAVLVDTTAIRHLFQKFVNEPQLHWNNACFWLKIFNIIITDYTVVFVMKDLCLCLRYFSLKNFKTYVVGRAAYPMDTFILNEAMHKSVL